jgi:hypothetical protein
MRDTHNQPAWASQIRHVKPGQPIIINRDEDGEEGDVGLARSSPPDSIAREKLANSGESSSEGTRREEMEMDEKRASGSEDAEAEQEKPGGAVAERSMDDDDNSPGTPRFAEYREGDDLIIERRKASSGDVSYVHKIKGVNADVIGRM